MRVRLTLIALVIILLSLVNMPLVERFTITDGKSGNIVFQDKLENYRDFYISFTHSVNKTPVNEYYRIEENKLVLYRAVFYSYGAGMPEVGEYGSGKPIVVDGKIIIDNINKEFTSFTYFAGTYSNHNLNTGSTKVFFSEFVKPQTAVTFEIKKLSVITLLKFHFMH